MRTAILIAVSALALGACYAIQNPFAKQDAKPAAAPAPIQAAAAPAPVAAPPEAPAADLNAIPASDQAAAPAAAAPQIVRWAAADWPRQEHRLAALIANAETRDTIGDTHRVVSDADARRQRCTTKACIERAYADEEAWLRQWEGSSSVK
jgi:hypothetical protein